MVNIALISLIISLLVLNSGIASAQAPDPSQYALVGKDSKCEYTRTGQIPGRVLKTKVPTKTALQECYKQCLAIEGCHHFGFGRSGTWTYCIGCDLNEIDMVPHRNYDLYSIKKPEPPYTKVAAKQECPASKVIATHERVTTQFCDDQCSKNEFCKTFSISDLAFKPVGMGSCKLCRAEFDFVSDEDSTVYSPLGKAAYEASLPFEVEVGGENKKCPYNKERTFKEDPISSILECHHYCDSLQDCTHFTFGLCSGKRPCCIGCKADETGMEDEPKFKVYKAKKARTWNYKMLNKEKQCQSSAVLDTFTVGNQDECFNACVAKDGCKTFSVSDRKFSPIRGGTCKLCSAEYGFSSHSDSSIYSILNAETYAASLDYKKLPLDNKKCPHTDERIFKKDPVSSIAECAELCDSIQGCKHFSLGYCGGSRLCCMGCNIDKIGTEDQGGFSIYEMKARDDWTYTNVAHKKSCQSYATIDVIAGTTQKACRESCANTDGCSHFSINDMGWAPIGGGTCKLCKGKYGRASDTKSNIYSIMDPVAHAAAATAAKPYTHVASDTKCPYGNTNRLFKIDPSVGLQSCYEACDSIQNCNYFSVGYDSGGDYNCMGCIGGETALEKHKNFDVYKMPGRDDWKFTKVAAAKECPAKYVTKTIALATQEECQKECSDTPGCGFFSISDMKFDPIGSGTCKLCSTVTGFSSATEANTYSILSPENYKPACSGSTGVVWGDPHFITYDKLKYDCQGRGEFVLAKGGNGNPLEIHGRFTNTGGSARGPSVMRSIAMKVDPTVDILQVNIPDMPSNGTCAWSFSYGLDENKIKVDDIVSFMTETYSGKANVYLSETAVVITFPDSQARIELLVKHSMSKRFGCRMRANICLTPDNHGGAANIVGMLGSPDGNKWNDWMSGAEGNALIDVPKTHKEARKQGSGYCKNNWCIANYNQGSLYSQATHALYNECKSSTYDPEAYEAAIQDLIQKMGITSDGAEALKGCDTTDDPFNCKMDLVLSVNGTDVNPKDVVREMKEEEKQAEEVADTRESEMYAEATWSTPDVDTLQILSTTTADATNGIVTEIQLKVPEESPDPACPVCKATGWGDPHIITFDGVAYDVHVKGELTFLKSLNSTFTIQARTQIVANHWKGPAVTTGVVVHEDSTKTFNDTDGTVKHLPDIQVSIAQDEDGDNVREIGRCPINLFVDGLSRDIAYGTGTEGATVQVKGRRIVVEYPTTKLRLDIQVKIWRNTCHFSVRYILADCRCSETLVGILGQPDKNWKNDWHHHNGTAVEIPKSRRDRVTKKAYDYSLTWCLDNAAMSHFTYESAELGFQYFDNCTVSNYDNTLDNAIDNASTKTVEKCTINNVLDEACVIECELLEDGACDDYVDEVENTETAEVNIQADGVRGENGGSLLGDVPVSGGEIAKATIADAATTDAGSKGDPHFKMWNGEHFEYHGQCDLVLTKDKTFADGLGLDVQIRTKLVRYWSYISSTAIRIGSDILEVQGSGDLHQTDPIFWYNFEYRSESAKSIGGFPLTFVKGFGKNRKHRFEIDLSSKYPGQKIIIATMKEFVKVEFDNASVEAFGNTVGMLGDFKTSTLLARDGKTKINDYMKLGDEWQVVPGDDTLFRNVEDPQFPKRCVLPEDPQGQRRRRLGESSISAEDAEAACSNTLKDAADIKDCVYDIVATQDLDMAGAF